MRTDWTVLAEDLRTEIEANTGSISRVDPAPTGIDMFSAAFAEQGARPVRSAITSGFACTPN